MIGGYFCGHCGGDFESRAGRCTDSDFCVMCCGGLREFYEEVRAAEMLEMFRCNCLGVLRGDDPMPLVGPSLQMPLV